MTPLQTKAAIALFESGQILERSGQDGQPPLFDTADIAELLGVHEAEVLRVLTASRDIVREMYRDMTTAANAP